jgi:hypothetical protein
MTQQKKAFRNPELVVYGDIRRITQNVTNQGVADNGAAPTHKS